MEYTLKRAMVLRLFFGLVAQTSMLFGVKLLPITISNLIINTYPFFVAILSYFILKEDITIMDVVGLIGSFTGVVILVIDKESQEENDEKHHVLIGVIFSAVTALGASGSTICTRLLKDVHYSTVVFFYSGFASLAYLIWLVFEFFFIENEHKGPRMFTYPLYPNWPLMMGCAVTNTAGLIFRTIAF